MYRYQTKHKVLSLLLVLALLILTSVMIFPSQASANYVTFSWMLVIYDGLVDSVPVNPPMNVQTLRVGVEDEDYVEFAVTLSMPEEDEAIGLIYDSILGWSSSTGHTVTDLGSIVEVYFDPPLLGVEEVTVGCGYVSGEGSTFISLNLFPPLDFGDAPDPTYRTLWWNSGAGHQISGLFLGASVDSEPNGQPTANADGDDNDINGDDEDGVTFITLLIPGNTANVNVTASAAGLLDAWVDFNINGDWSDVGEQVFNSQPLAPGVNNLSFGVPAVASIGTTFSRFRVSSNGGLSFDGPADDGEVEDYKILISEPEEPPVTEVGGEVYPVNKVSVLAPWIALSAAILAGVTIAVKRRRI